MRYRYLESKVIELVDNKDMLSDEHSIKYSNLISEDAEMLKLAVNTKTIELVTRNNKIVKTEEVIKQSLGKLLFNMILLAELNNTSLETLLEETIKNERTNK